MKRTRRFSLGMLTLLVIAFMCSAFAGDLKTPTNRLNNVKGAGYLSAPAQGDPLAISLDFLDANREKLGLSPADLADLEVVDRYTSKHTGVTHLYLGQTWNGINIYNGIINVNVAANGAIINLGSNFLRGLEHKIKHTQPALSAIQAGRLALADVGQTAPRGFGVVEEIGGASKEVLLSGEGVALDDLSAKLVYKSDSETDIRLAWQVMIEDINTSHIWIIHVDALSGKIMAKDDLVDHDSFGNGTTTTPSGPAHRKAAVLKTLETRGNANLGAVEDSMYLVYAQPAEDPDDSDRTIVTNPYNLTASPFGWHDTDGAAGAEFTITRGNNAHAYLDENADNVPDAPTVDGGAALDFTGELVPEFSASAAMVNLFYWNNIIHDITYLYGFNEAGGNFQSNNYGNGGLGDDYVFAEARDGSGTNNANFGTPPDGSNPRMQMFIFTQTDPVRDGDFANAVITHEYGHGVSNRLTGGPSTASCLGNTEQMGEGWSDWLGLFFTAAETDTAATPRATGTWVLGQEPDVGGGIRPAPYTTNMEVNAYTYGDIDSVSIPHGVGFVWATMCWDMYWALVDEYGFNADIYGAWNTGGNNLAMQLIMDGMKLQPCNPGFVDGRDAILAADVALTGGANQCLIWGAFARRGLGFSASQGSTSSVSDGVEAFDMPLTCAFLGLESGAATACAGATTTVDIAVGAAFTPNVDLTVSAPTGVTVTFAPNPVTAVPATVTATVAVDSGVAAGDYTFTVTGTDSTMATNDLTVNLAVYSGNAADPTGASPSDSSTDVPVNPLLSWTAGGNTQSFTVMVADNMEFNNPIVNETITGTSYQVTQSLAPLTNHWWSLTAHNPCGDSTTQVFMFTTELAYCQLPNTDIPDNVPAGVDLTQTITTLGNIDNLDVGLDISHTWVGDLVVTLTHEGTGTTVVLVDRMGGGDCQENDINVVLSDDGTTPIGNVCEVAVPTASGILQPDNPLSGFDGINIAGNWILNVSDHVGQDLGVLNGWCLYPTVLGEGEAPQLLVTPDAISVELERGGATEGTVVLSNIGGSDLNWTADESTVITGLGGGADVTLILDDGTEDTQIGDAGQFIWFNRFTPDRTAFPILLNEIHVGMGTTLVSAGDPLDLLVYADTDGDGDPATGAELLAVYNMTVQTPGAVNMFTLPEPLLLTGPGDILIGAINRAGTEGVEDFPAGIDTTASAGRSWVGSWKAGNVPANPTLPADEQWGTIDSFGLAGNWLIRAFGTSPTCSGTTDVSWMSLTPNSGTIAADNSDEITVSINTAGLANGVYLSGVCISSNDPFNPTISIPLSLTVTGPNRDPHTIGVFRPSTNAFYLDSGARMTMGASGDMPLVGDWNGDGIHDIGVFRPATGSGANTFYLRLRGGATFGGGATTITTRMGQAGDLPVVGDFDANGVSTIGVFRPSNANFYIRYGAYNGAVRRTAMGATGDIPVIGDWDGDGHHTVGVYRPSNNTFYMRNTVVWSLNRGDEPVAGLLGSDSRVVMGASGDMPLVGDWDGDGDSDIGVFRPSNNNFYMRVLNGNFSDLSATTRDGILGGDTRRQMGAPGDMPLIGDWN